MITRKMITFLKLIKYASLSTTCVKQAHFLSAEETTEFVCKNRVSVIRYGDGEFNLMNGRSVSYQPWSQELQDDLYKVINDYLTENASYILCMPGEFLMPNGTKLTPSQLKSWAFSRYFFKNHYDTNALYGDAFLFARENEQVYRAIWEKNEIAKVVFVHNDEKYSRTFSKKYLSKTIFVQIPKYDAFASLLSIKNKIKRVADTQSLILISAGPAAKSIVKDLSNEGFWCIDTGHCWDGPLQLRKRG